MLDNSADEISTAEARSIIEDLDRHFGTEALRFIRRGLQASFSVAERPAKVADHPAS